MEGGPSHIDTFDPKPALEKLAGQPLPSSYKPVILAMGEQNPPLMASKRKWKQHGQSGLWVSDWYPHVAEQIDDICVVRSVWSDAINHSGGVCQMNTGSVFAGRPSLGSWVTYGLGTENQNLPAFVVLEGDLPAWLSMARAIGVPASCLRPIRKPVSSKEPIRFLANPAGITERRRKARLVVSNESRALRRPHHQTELDARIKSYELAFRMQAEAPVAVDLASETAETNTLYGIDEKDTEQFGRMCLLSRRLVERVCTRTALLRCRQQVGRAFRYREESRRPVQSNR